MKRHPLEPLIRFIGHDLTNKALVTTITSAQPAGLPRLYETAVNTEPVERYNSHREAKEGHARHVKENS